MGLFKREKAEPEYVLAASISNQVSSAIYQDILKNNGIPFVCRQQGAGGYIKILTGGLLAPDNIYVAPADLEKAEELYKAYIENMESEEPYPDENDGEA